MGVLDLVRGRRSEQAIAEGHHYIDERDEKRPGISDDVAASYDSDTVSLEAKAEKEIERRPDRVTETAQLGVKKAEAAALVWSKTAVWCTYAWIWVCYFTLALQSGILFAAGTTAFSTFYAAPAYATAAILSNIIGGVIKIPIAKILNIWGRTEGFLIFFVVYLIGMIVLASCKDANTFAGGYTIYLIGYDALYLILDIFIADTSGLRIRAFTWAFAATPFICTAFVGPIASQSLLAPGGAGWRWAIGIFCVVQPFVFLPLAMVFKFYQNKAAKMGLFVRQPSGRTTMQSLVHYFHEFDVIGCILLMAAFILFLLPFSLVTYMPAVTYHSAEFIAMVVIGALLFPAFWAWEKYGARVYFMDWALLKDRTVLGACLSAFMLYFSFYTWDSTFLSFLYVAYDLSIKDATYMTYIYNVGSCFWGPIFGAFVYFTKHFKWSCLVFAVPLFALGSGLMIYFRGNDKPIGYLVMCQIFIAFAGGQLVIANQLAVMAAADRNGVPLMISLLYVFNAIGGAIGSAVAVSIYGNVFPQALRESLPAADLVNVTTWYTGGYFAQLDYAVGTPERNSFNYAWGRTQYYQTIASTAVISLGFVGVALWKNYNVDRKQNKGTMM